MDYEAWVDDYVVFMDKYAANPTDSSLITDYTAFANEALELQQRASKVPSDLTLEQATESETILLRVAQKLNEAAAKLAG